MHPFYRNIPFMDAFYLALKVFGQNIDYGQGKQTVLLNIPLR
jgi:hypothetical protein